MGAVVGRSEAAVIERVDMFCGCAFVQTGGKWYQVVACPDHDMGMEPLDDLPNLKPGHE